MTSHAPSGPTALVGRADELAALLAFCATGSGATMVVSGAAGIGKTRLLDELGRRTGAAGTLVLRGHAVPGGGAFRPVAEALIRAAPPSLAEDARLGPFRGVLARLLPAWPAPPEGAGHLVDPVVVLGEAVLELLRVISAGTRCVVLLDDMHWADRDTLSVLEYVGGGLAELPVHLVLAARDDEGAPDELDALRRNAGSTPLRRMDDEHVAVLARRCAAGPVSADVVGFLVGAADGLPLLVEELFAGLVETGRIRRDELGWHSAAPLVARVPDAFARLVERRLAALPGTAVTVVRTAAVLGGDPEWRELAAATSLGEDVVAAAVRAATAAGLFVVDGEQAGALRWRHALTRDAVLGRLSPPERERLSLQAVDALTTDHDALRGERLALAANLCARSGFSTRAAELLLLVERENIAAGALAAAEDGLREAARLAADGSAVVGEIAVERLRVLALGARTDEALAIGDEMIPAVGVAARRRLALQLTRACVAAERWSQAQHYLDVAAAAAQSGTVGADPEPLALAAHVALGLHERDEALRLAAAAVDAGERTDWPEVVCEALEVTGRALRRADPPASRAAFAAGERLAALRGLVPWRIRALAELGTHDILAGEGIGRLEQARLLALECGMLGTATGLDLQIAAGTTSSAGHVAALPYARRCAEQSARLHLPGPRGHALMFVARGLFWAGATAESDAVLEESARTVAYPMNALTTRDAHRGYACWLAHDEEGGVAGLGAGVAHLRASAVSNPAPVWGHWALLATVVHPRDDGPLTELRHSDLLVQGSIRAAVHYADAVVATRAGRLEAARSLLAEGDAAVAGKAHERLFLRCLLVGTNAAAAPFEAEPLLREALTLWEPAGEVRLARWCRERLRMLGHPVPRPERDRTAVPARLRAVGVTGRELEVLRLVAAGSSNAEVAARLHLSRRTVETHVSHLLAKTGVAGRVALAEWLPS